MDAEESLRRVGLFQGLQPKQIKSLAKWTHQRTYEPGQAIVSQGQLGVGLYCIQSGLVRVTMQTPSGETELRSMRPGQAFGELALLDDRPRSATVTAIEATTALLLDKAQFLAELNSNPEIALALIPVLVAWLRDTDQKLADAL